MKLNFSKINKTINCALKDLKLSKRCMICNKVFDICAFDYYTFQLSCPINCLKLRISYGVGVNCVIEDFEYMVDKYNYIMTSRLVQGNSYALVRNTQDDKDTSEQDYSLSRIYDLRYKKQRIAAAKELAQLRKLIVFQ